MTLQVKSLYINNTSQAGDRDLQQAQVLHLSKLKISHLEKAYGAEVLVSAQIRICPFNLIKSAQIRR